MRAEETYGDFRNPLARKSAMEELTSPYLREL